VRQATSDVLGAVASLGLRILLERFDEALTGSVPDWDPALAGRNSQPCTPMRASNRS
jgi:hypothetical protein